MPPARPGVKPRHDGFTAEKRRRFFVTLAETGCLKDAARRASISKTTVNRWRARDAEFDRLCMAALDRASQYIEVLAWERAVTGIEEPVYHGGKFSHMRVNRSDSIFRMLLMASNRKKYGRMGAVDRKRIERKLRKKIDKEQRRLGGQRTPRTADELRVLIMEKLREVKRRYAEAAKDGRGPLAGNSPDVEGSGESLNRPEE